MKDKKTKIKQIIVLILSIVFILVVCWFIGKPMISLASDPEKFRVWVEDLGFLGQLAYIGMLIFQIIFAIIPGEPFEIVAGYAFGAIEGTILCIIGSTVGSLIVYAFVRTFGRRIVEIFFSLDKINELKFLKDSKKRDILSFLIFLVPGTPKDLLLYFLGLTKMELPVFLIIVSIGRIPSIITSTVGGNALGKQDYVFAIITFAVTIVVSICGYLLYQFISKKHQKRKEK